MLLLGVMCCLTCRGRKNPLITALYYACVVFTGTYSTAKNSGTCDIIIETVTYDYTDYTIVMLDGCEKHFEQYKCINILYEII